MRAVRFGCFDTVLGRCGLAWRDDLVVGSQLPEATAEATRRRMARQFPGALDVGAIDRSVARQGREGASTEPARDLVPTWIRLAAARIEAALAGQADDLVDLPLDLASLAAFERKVYAAARAIPYGSTVSYGELARSIGEPGAARAVGRALGRNPFAPIVPCHRVLAADTRAGGFSATGGVSTKLRMLLAEGALFGEEPGLFDPPDRHTAPRFRTVPQFRAAAPAAGACAERVASAPARSISRSASAR